MWFYIYLFQPFLLLLGICREPVAPCLGFVLRAALCTLHFCDNIVADTRRRSPFYVCHWPAQGGTIIWRMLVVPSSGSGVPLGELGSAGTKAFRLPSPLFRAPPHRNAHGDVLIIFLMLYAVPSVPHPSPSPGCTGNPRAESLNSTHLWFQLSTTTPRSPFQAQIAQLLSPHREIHIFSKSAFLTTLPYGGFVLHYTPPFT